MPNKKLIPILLLTLVNTLGFSILIPVLPFIIKQYDSSEVVFGLLLSAYSAFQFLAAPFLGSLSDYWGRKPVLLITQTGTLLSWLVFAVAYFLSAEILWLGAAISIWVIGIARMVDGVTGGNNSVTNAYLGDTIPRDEKAGAFGLLGATFGVGMILGPAIGGLTMSTPLGYLGTALFAMALSFVTLLSIIFFLPESLANANRSETLDTNVWHQINLWRKVRQWKENPLIQTTIQLRVIFGLVLASYTSIIALYMIDLFGLSPSQLAWVLLFVGSFMIFNQTFLVKPTVKKLGAFPTLLLALGLMSFGLMGMSFAGELWQFIMVYYFTNLGVSLLMPTVMSVLSNEVSEKEQGEMTGVIEGLSAFSMAVAPVAAAWAYGQLGSSIYALFASVMLVALAWFWWGYRQCTRHV
jgi:MFS family permease